LYRILNSGRDTTDASNLVRLAQTDANACSAVLEELIPLLPAFADGFQSRLVSGLWLIIENVKNDELAYLAGTAISQINGDGDHIPDTTSHALEMVKSIKITSVDSSPTVTESSLRLWSKCAQSYLESHTVPSEHFSTIVLNLTQFRLLLNEDMVRTRLTQRSHLTFSGLHGQTKRCPSFAEFEQHCKVAQYGGIPACQVELLLPDLRLPER
jgi:hypothetical protein